MKTKTVGALLIVALIISAGVAMLAGRNVPAKESQPQPSREQMQEKVRQSDYARAVGICKWTNGSSNVSQVFPFWNGQTVMCKVRCLPESIHKEGATAEWECGT